MVLDHLVELVDEQVDTRDEASGCIAQSDVRPRLGQAREHDQRAKLGLLGRFRSGIEKRQRCGEPAVKPSIGMLPSCEDEPLRSDRAHGDVPSGHERRNGQRAAEFAPGARERRRTHAAHDRQLLLGDPQAPGGDTASTHRPRRCRDRQLEDVAEPVRNRQSMKDGGGDAGRERARVEHVQHRAATLGERVLMMETRAATRYEQVLRAKPRSAHPGVAGAMDAEPARTQPGRKVGSSRHPPMLADLARAPRCSTPATRSPTRAAPCRGQDPSRGVDDRRGSCPVHTRVDCRHRAMLGQAIRGESGRRAVGWWGGRAGAGAEIPRGAR